MLLEKITEACYQVMKYGDAPNTVEMSPVAYRELVSERGGGVDSLVFMHVAGVTLFVRALDIAPPSYIYVMHNPEYDWWFRETERLEP